MIIHLKKKKNIHQCAVETAGLAFRAADFERITAHCIFQPSNVTSAGQATRNQTLLCPHRHIVCAHLQRRVSTTTSRIKWMWNSTARRVGLCDYIIDAQCSHTVKVDRTFNVKLLTISSFSSCCCLTFILTQIS